MPVDAPDLTLHKTLVIIKCMNALYLLSEYDSANNSLGKTARKWIVVHTEQDTKPVGQNNGSGRFQAVNRLNLTHTHLNKL